MIYIQGLSAQTEIFIYSLGFGFLLGILYDVFRTVRVIISNRKAFVVAMDLLYFAVCAVLIFSFNLVVDSGRIRMYVVLGEILGWFIYYFSFGAIAMKVSNAVIGFVKRFFAALTKPVKRFFAFVKRKTRKSTPKFIKTIKKYNKNIKFILQKHKGIVYNLISYNEK